MFAPLLAACDAMDAAWLASVAAYRTWLAVLEATAAAPPPPSASLPHVMAATLDRLNDAMETVIAERDALRCRVALAVAELDAAPDVNPDTAGKRRVREVVAANTRAWAVLTEGRDPPSRRRAEDAPRDAGEKT